MTTVEQAAEYQGALCHRDLDDGRVLVLYPMLFTWRLCLGWQGDAGYTRAWCYPPERLADAINAQGRWDGNTADPPGRWIKEVGTERRRPVR